jgi:hypothetical protein
MDFGIALDGEGQLGRPAAVTAIASAADRLDYRSIWCIGPWALTLAGAVAAVTTRVRIGIADPPTDDAIGRAISGDRLVLGGLERWPVRPPGPSAADRPRSVLIDVSLDDLALVGGAVDASRALGVSELIVRLVGDPDVDAALAAYARLGELAAGSSA